MARMERDMNGNPIPPFKRIWKPGQVQVSVLCGAATVQGPPGRVSLDDIRPPERFLVKDGEKFVFYSRIACHFKITGGQPGHAQPSVALRVRKGMRPFAEGPFDPIRVLRAGGSAQEVMSTTIYAVLAPGTYELFVRLDGEDLWVVPLSTEDAR